MHRFHFARNNERLLCCLARAYRGRYDFSVCPQCDHLKPRRWIITLGSPCHVHVLLAPLYQCGPVDATTEVPNAVDLTSSRVPCTHSSPKMLVALAILWVLALRSRSRSASGQYLEMLPTRSQAWDGSVTDLNSLCDGQSCDGGLIAAGQGNR